MTQYQATVDLESGGRLMFGLEADNEDAAWEIAANMAPSLPRDVHVEEIQPRCPAHGVRHDCAKFFADRERH